MAPLGPPEESFGVRRAEYLPIERRKEMAQALMIILRVAYIVTGAIRVRMAWMTRFYVIPAIWEAGRKGEGDAGTAASEADGRAPNHSAQQH